MANYLGIELFLGTDYSVCTRSILWQNEFWKPIKRFEDYYLISSLGRVKSLDRIVPLPHSQDRIVKGKIMKRSLNLKGYLDITFSIDKVKVKATIHRIVGENFIKRVVGKHMLNHKDGIKTNPSMINLEWCTAQENVDHAIRTGLKSSIGENNPTSKLKTADVIKIKQLLKTGLTPPQIAVDYPVNPEALYKIRDGRTWKHIIV